MVISKIRNLLEGIQKTYRENNPEYHMEYYHNNKEQVFAYRRNKYKTDPLFALKSRVRRLVNITITNGGYTKKSKTHEILGIDWVGLKEHFERQFTKGMNWENRDRWHIDHIIPLATAQSEDDIIRLNHYTNLQPLWAKDQLKQRIQDIIEINLLTDRNADFPSPFCIYCIHLYNKLSNGKI